ncbi:MAG: alpha/beta hydrolase [Paraglaciecola sp.]|nr:alpha/beta hydrolase [Paraglaciecola sp.]
MLKALLFILITLLIGLAISLYKDSSRTGLFILNSALKISQGIEVVRDLEFAKQPWQKLDVYPSPNTKIKAPVLVFIYGGGWSWGNKEMNYFVAQAFVKRGYTVVIPDYIKYPQGHFPDFIKDGALALAWVKANIGQYNGDPNQLFIAGHSAGAHTGALLVSDQQYLADVGMSIDDIKGFAGLAGPYTFTPKSAQYIATFGEENFQTMKVSSHIDGNTPPMLLLHAQGDSTVGLFNQQDLAAALQSKGQVVQTKVYGTQINHINILLKLHPWFADEVNTGQDVDTFFKTLIQ